MSNDPKLRAVPDPPHAEEDVSVVESDAPERSGTPLWIPVVLGLLLAVCIALLGWSRLELAEGAAQISSLEQRVGFLESVVAQRDGEIAAQKSRLSDVRAGVQGLLSLLDAPVEAQPE